jgi:hypothetical protein
MIKETEKAESAKIQYSECTKSGLHFGEVCNMVCMELSCVKDPLCCCVCLEELHKKHKYAPIDIAPNRSKWC